MFGSYPARIRYLIEDIRPTAQMYLTISVVGPISVPGAVQVLVSVRDLVQVSCTQTHHKAADVGQICHTSTGNSKPYIGYEQRYEILKYKPKGQKPHCPYVYHVYEKHHECGQYAGAGKEYQVCSQYA